jgi:hypothetical protein
VRLYRLRDCARRASKNLLLIAVVTIFLTGSGMAQAFVDPPYITPYHPDSSTELTLNIRGGECDDFIAYPPSIVQTVNTVDVLVYTTHTTDPLFCFVPVYISTYSLGVYPPGSYNFSVSRTYEGLGTIVEHIANVPVEVVAANALPVATPTLHSLALLVLAAGIVLLGRRHVKPDVHSRHSRTLMAPMDLMAPIFR